MNFDFYMPIKLITGSDCVRKNAMEMAKLGHKCLIITSRSAGKKSGALDDVTAALDSVGVSYLVYDQVEPNPSLAGCKQAGDIARENGAQFIVGVGGGSPLDAAKAAAIYAANDIELMSVYDLDWKQPALPLVLVGTTAGTGSEVSPTAVLTTPDGYKKSVVHPQCFATIALGDPKYTYSLPLSFTVSTALDALSHAIEGYFATSATEFSDLFAVQAVKILNKELTALHKIQSEEEITHSMRDQLYYASVLAGLTLARCGTCYCHNLGYYLTEKHDIPHGIACAVFLADFLHRGCTLVPEKAGRLLQGAECDAKSLCDLIESLCVRPDIRLGKEEIQALAARTVDSKNFRQTAPDGYTQVEAVELLTKLFA